MRFEKNKTPARSAGKILGFFRSFTRGNRQKTVIWGPQIWPKSTEISEKNEKEVQEKMVEHVKKLLEDNSVATRDEIDRIVERLDKVVVDDSNTKQFEIMGNLFDSTDVKVINWKCNLLKLLRNGVAPNIDEEKFVRNGIPLGSVSSFLKKIS